MAHPVLALSINSVSLSIKLVRNEGSSRVSCS